MSQILMNKNEVELWRNARKLDVKQLVTQLENLLDFDDWSAEVCFQELKRKLGLTYNFPTDTSLKDIKERQIDGYPESAVTIIDDETLEIKETEEDKIKRLLQRKKLYKWSNKDIEEMLHESKVENDVDWINDLQLLQKVLSRPSSRRVI